MQGDAANAGHNGCFVQVCLDLGQLLWQDQCNRWTAMSKAWISEQRVLSCVRCCMQGQRVGDTPVFNGMCARCGHLLDGPVNKHCATTSKKFTGVPRNINGLPCNADAQPPFFPFASKGILCVCSGCPFLGRNEQPLVFVGGAPRDAALESCPTP